MGLDIGAAQIKYLPRPEKPVYNFAWHLNINDAEADWSGSSSTSVEYTGESLLDQLGRYILENVLLQSDVEGFVFRTVGMVWLFLSPSNIGGVHARMETT